MGLVILLVVGAVLGWLASIVLQREDRTSVLTLVGAGSGGAVVVGLIGSGANPIVAISAIQLLWAVFGAGIAIALIGIFRRPGLSVKPEFRTYQSGRHRLGTPPRFQKGEES